MNRRRTRRGRMKNKRNNYNILSLISIIVILLILTIFATDTKIASGDNNLIETSEANETNTTFENTLEENQVDNNNNDSNVIEVYFIDVGQADSILIVNNNESMLIDAGNNEDGDDVVNFIKDKGIEKLNYVVGTHPHEDHIGGLDDVIDNFEIENIYMPKIETTTKTFEDVLDSVANKNLTITSPNKGETFTIGEAQCEIMTDSILDKNNLNLSSIVIKLQFGNKSFLFMGDSEIDNEETRQWPKVDVLKVGHHGSITSSSSDFLRQVSPEYAIIMVGEDNTYELPKNEIINRIENLEAKIYRTDKNGTIEMISNGNEITVKTEKDY